jgi:hypothetical protein
MFKEKASKSFIGFHPSTLAGDCRLRNLSAPVGSTGNLSILPRPYHLPPLVASICAYMSDLLLIIQINAHNMPQSNKTGG